MRSTESPSHSFDIYLVVSLSPEQQPWQKPWDTATLGNLADLILEKEPVISGADILSYDFANHKLLVRQSALSRLPAPSVWHQPFVVVADGQRIYVGAFSTMASSHAMLSVPTITVDFRPVINGLTVEWSHVDPVSVANPDPRSDDRIRTALAGLRKLQ